MRPINLHRLGDIGFFAFLLAGVLIAVAAVDYHTTRLEREVIESHQRIATVEARHALDHLVNTLDAVNLALQSLPESDWFQLAPHPNSLLVGALAHQPHLRSLSVVNAAGQIIASSNPHNIGLRPDLFDFLPPTDVAADLLRIGPAHSGRDINDGQRIRDRSGTRPVMEFFPVLRSMTPGRATPLSLLAVINVDYFLNRLAVDMPDGLDRVDVLRHDGALLFSTRSDVFTPATLAANDRIATLWQSNELAGVSEESIAGEGDFITAWRVARILPVVVVSRFDRNRVLAEARAESRNQQWLLVPLITLILASVLVAYLMYRRARQLAMQADESRRLARLLDALPANVLLFAEDGRAQITNLSWKNFARQHGFATVDENGLPLHYRSLDSRLTPPLALDDAVGLGDGIGAVLQRQMKSFDGEFSFDTANGLRWLHIMVRPFARENAHGVTLLQLDITDRKRAEEGMQMLEAALKATASAVVITDPNAVIEWANPAFARLTGFSPSEAIGRTPQELVCSGKQDASFYADMWKTILNGEVWRGELINKHKNGALYHESLTITPVLDREGKPKHFVAVKEDVTERKQKESDLRRQATTDPLTGCMNRRALIDSMTLELQRIKRHNRDSCFMMLDIDHFKRVNDEYGHAAGDVVLKHFCTLATAALRKVDLLGRIGGEEFGILLLETNLEGGVELAERLRAALEASTVHTDGITISITVSIGVAALNPDDRDPDQVLARADQALYRAKTKGRNRVEPSMEAPPLPT